ncbi:MAG: ATP-binding protein [Thermoanaerobaculia bacterium]|nr:ATP-binding protein [Thermoanaerobaculia bacterium]
MVVRGPLRARLQLAITLSVLLFGGLNILLVGRITYSALRAEQDRRLNFVVRLLAQRAAQPLLIDDDLAVQKLLEESRRLDPDLVAISVTGPSGDLIAMSKSETSNPSSPRREAIADILGGRLGQVHAGVEEASLRSTTGKVLSVIAMMVLGFLATGVVGAVLIARSITKPIEHLVTFASTFRLDRPLPELDVRSEDEIAQLAEHLESATRQLQQFHLAARAQERHLARVEHLATVGMLAAGVAHEINNPLAGIRTSVERLLRHTKDPRDAERYGSVLRDAIARIERAVKGTLTFARAAEVNLAPARLQDCLERALELAAPRLEEIRAILTQSVAADLPEVTADAAQITQVLLNLILNACDAITEGGRITITSSREENFAVVSVSDSGPGVAAEIREKIFSPFFTTKAPGKGTGLGLAVSRTALREMGGDLSLAAGNGEGACFEIRLPWAERTFDGANSPR